MANRPHVPKFGDWSNQDQPFTVVFDNARNKRQDLYESLEKPETKTQPKPPPPRNQRQEPPKSVWDEPPRTPPPTDKVNKVRAPPTEQLYGGYGGGVGNQRPPQPPRPVQPKYNPRGGNNGRGGTTIPPFPGSVGAGENMSYTHIFDQVKEQRNREGARPYGEASNDTPSRPINGPAPTPSKFCCFPWFRK